ncbi:hypothetical protein ACIPRL_29420 [Streptomyces sp. NPDC090085]|uniref:hypothetical protein n=1 Tax=Streptomyces sp. NPDC090085 TaxID=3365943 RepID=UPI003811A621
MSTRTDGEPHSYGSPFALHFVFLLDHVAPADFTEAAASDEDVSAAMVDGRLVLTLTACGGDPVWPPAGYESPTH